MTGDRIEIHVYRGDEAIIMSDRLPDVALHSHGLLSSMAWLEPAVINLLWQVAHQLTDKTPLHYDKTSSASHTSSRPWQAELNTIREEGNG